MTDPLTTIETEAAKALVQAAVKGFAILARKVPALFKRQGKAKEQHVTDEIERTVTRLKKVTGSALEREQTRQEATWEVLLRGLLVEYPEAAEDLKALMAEISAALPDTRSVQGVVGEVNARRDAYVVGRDNVTINHNNHDPGESQLELPAVTLTEDGPEGHSSVVLDLQLRNTGGQSALLHRVTIHIHDAINLELGCFLPYEPEWLVDGHLPVTKTYDINLPGPHQAVGTHHDLRISQTVRPYDTDRFAIRLGVFQWPLAYKLHFDINYDMDRVLTSPTIAIAHPPGSTLATISEIRSDLQAFRDAVREVRDAIDREIAIRGLPALDWDNQPPTNHADLPANLRSVNRDPGYGLAALGTSRSGAIYEVSEAFWNPDSSLTRRLHDIHAHYSRVVSIITGADIRHDSLPQILTQAQTVLAQLPALHADLSTSERAITVQEPAPSGNPDVADELVRLVGGLEELQARANAGDQDSAQQLNTATRLIDKVRRLGPDHPEALTARETLIFWLGRWDKAGAAVALAQLISDQERIYDPDDPRTLRARHYLAMFRGETGNAAKAAAAFEELVNDRIQAMGPDHPDTLDSQSELGRWHAMAGNLDRAVAVFTRLVADRTRVQHPDHPRTLHARHGLAMCRGKAGDAAGAAAAFEELVNDQIRVQGLNHPDTLECKRQLARWQDQAGPESASTQE